MVITNYRRIMIIFVFIYLIRLWLQLALRDAAGAYLSPIGSKAVLKTRSQTVTKDELFSLEDSLPQASFIAALNSRYVSVKQGELLFFLSAIRILPYFHDFVN